MLRIRLFRGGKKHQPSYKIVVVDKKRAPKGGRFIDILGFLNPMEKTKSVDAEKAKHWISKGAQPSDTVHNLLVKEGAIDGKKIDVHKKSKKTEEEIKAEAEKKAEAVAKAEAPAPVEEPKEPASVENSGVAKEEKKEEVPVEAPKEETPVEEKPTEEPKEEAPTETPEAEKKEPSSTSAEAPAGREEPKPETK